MKIWIALLFISMALSACTSSAQKSSSQFVSENLLHGLPDGWIQGFSVRKGNMGMKEFIPADQTVDNWDEMITTQIFFGGLEKSAEEFQSQLGSSWKESCPRSFVNTGKSGIENGYKSIFWQQFCENNPRTGLPEVTLFKAIEGNDSFYLIQKAWKKIPTKEEIVNWTKFMANAYVCDSRLPERACPNIN